MLSPRDEISRVLKENDAIGTFFVSGYLVIDTSEMSAEKIWLRWAKLFVFPLMIRSFFSTNSLLTSRLYQ